MIKFVSTAVFVKDIKKSRAFYEEILEQKIMMDNGPHVAFMDGFSIWQQDHALDVMSEKDATAGPLGRKNMELYFETIDVNAEFERLKKSGVEILHSVMEQPWGQKVFRILDPDGHIVEVGEPMPLVVKRYSDSGMKDDEIAERTHMPVDLIHAILEQMSAEG